MCTYYVHFILNIKQGQGRGVSQKFREGATCMCAAQSLIRGVLS